MKPRTTLILAVIAVLVIAGGWYFGLRTTRPEASSLAGVRPAFPNAAQALQQAARITIKHQGKALALERHGNVWGVADDSGYPALPSKVHDLLAGLANLRLTEPRTADPAEFDRLGVEDPDKPHADSTLVSVSDAQGKPIIALIVGHSRSRGQDELPDQIFVRRPGEAQSWLAEGRLYTDDDALMWLDRSIINIDHTKIATVSSTRGGQTIELARDGDKLVMKQPAQHPELDPSKLGDVARSLEFLNFLRVKPGTKMPGTELGHGELTTTDGLKVDVTVNQSGNEVWARFAAKGDGAAKDQAAQLEKKFAAWTYELGGWKEKALVPSMDDLKVPAPPPKEPSPAPKAEASPAQKPEASQAPKPEASPAPVATSAPQPASAPAKPPSPTASASSPQSKSAPAAAAGSGQAAPK